MMRWTLLLLWIMTAVAAAAVDHAKDTVGITATTAMMDNEIVYLPGHTVENDYQLPLPHTYIAEQDLPKDFHWGNVNGKSFLTRNRNQHLPQWYVIRKKQQASLIRAASFFFLGLVVFPALIYQLVPVIFSCNFVGAGLVGRTGQ